MGYLNKLGKAPNTNMERFHSCGINTIFILILLCGHSVKAYRSRGVNVVYVGQCSMNKTSLVLRNTYFSYKSYGKQDTNFTVKMSDIHIFDTLLPSTCHDMIHRDDPENNRIMGSCFIAEVLSITPQLQCVLETVLAHEILPCNDNSDKTFSFLREPTKFGTGNCATHHICNNHTLFIGEIEKVTHIGVKGVGGIAEVVGMGTIRFRIKDESEEITLHNIIYLPDCPKNLISITRWSEDRGDNCGVFSRGKYSIFLWNNDRSKKVIYHPPDYPIPLMSVNEGEIDQYHAFFLDLSEEQLCPYIDTVTGKETPTEVAQQTTKEGLNLHVGSIV